MSIKIPREIIHALDSAAMDRIEQQVTIVEKHDEDDDDHDAIGKPKKKFAGKAKKIFRPKKEICTLHYHNDPPPSPSLASKDTTPSESTTAKTKKPRKKTKRDLFVEFARSIEDSVVLDHFYLPFACACSLGYRSYRPDIPKTLGWPAFQITLRPEQETVLGEAVDHLKKESCVLIAMYPGGGKTMTTIRLARVLGLPTLIIVNRLVLMDQWRSSIERCLGPDVPWQYVDVQNPPRKGNLFYIINAINVPKFSTKVWSFGLGLGTVIVDECHLIMTTVFIQSLGRVAPRFLIGLSATPYRYDGMNDLFKVYFGAPRTVIHRPLRRHHYVYPLPTPISIENEYDATGRLIWNKVVHEQAMNPQRQQWIAQLCGLFPDRHILILGKRIEALEQIDSLLKTAGESTTVFTGTEVAYDTTARIMLSTFSKVGTGFSHDCLDMLILMNDCEGYFIQYLGRVFRRPDVVPLIFDIIDKHSVLQSHFRTRRALYHEVGAEFRDPPPEWKQWVSNRVLKKKES